MKIQRPEPLGIIPSDAKKVFTGKLFSVFQWEQKLFDGTYAIFEKLRRIDTVEIIPVTEDKKIIIAMEEQPGVKPFIGFPGGRIDVYEDPLEAAKRELLEETGYHSPEFILWEGVQTLTKIDWAMYIFIAKNCTKIAQQHLDSGEKITLKEITFDELLAIVSRKEFRDREVALKILRIKEDKNELRKMKQLFLE